MLGRTHRMFAISVAFVVLRYHGLLRTLTAFESVVVFYLIILGSMLPDIDHSGSIIGKQFPWISKLVKHRGFFHSLLALVLWYGVFILILNQVYVFAILIGYVSHLLLDVITVSGIKLFQPLININFAGPITTGGTFERLFYYFLIGFNVFFALSVAHNFSYLMLFFKLFDGGV